MDVEKTPQTGSCSFVPVAPLRDIAQRNARLKIGNANTELTVVKCEDAGAYCMLVLKNDCQLKITRRIGIRPVGADPGFFVQECANPHDETPQYVIANSREALRELMNILVLPPDAPKGSKIEDFKKLISNILANTDDPGV